jgi:hypothetical protein
MSGRRQAVEEEKALINKRRFFFLQVTCLAGCCPWLAAQTTGRIVGTVKDQTGAVVVAAQVTAISNSTAEQRQARTDDAGRYVLALLRPGAYQMTVTAQGFKAESFNDVTVLITETTYLEINLVVAMAPAESVTVGSTDTSLQRDGPQLGRVVQSTSLTQLPLVARNFTQILGLSPGTAGFLTDGTSVGRNTQTVSVNGARVTQNNFQLNGVDVNGMLPIRP